MKLKVSVVSNLNVAPKCFTTFEFQNSKILESQLLELLRNEELLEEEEGVSDICIFEPGSNSWIPLPQEEDLEIPLTANLTTLKVVAEVSLYAHSAYLTSF